MKEFVLVFKPKVARGLLRLGNPIVDIKADKENSDRTIFVFRNTEQFRNNLTTIEK